MQLALVLGTRLPTRRSGAVIPTGGLLSVVVADSTPIDPVSSIGASGNGWVAAVTLKGLTSLVGTVNAAAFTMQVQDPGFDANKNAVTVSRTLTGIAHLRRQYPNGGSKMISTDGTNVTVLVTLDGEIYAGTTLVSAAITSGFYPSATAGNAGSTTNGSSLAYPTPCFGWLNSQQESAGNSFAVEAVAFHYYARAGQQVACIEYQVTDGTNTASPVLVSTPSTSAFQTLGNICEAWQGTVDMTGMTQGTMCTVNAKIYPWLGTVYNVATSGTAWPTSRPITPLRVFCDRTGGYGGAYAYVKAGASGGTTSATPSVAALAPYPTITAAFAGVKAWNNTNKSHNDLGGGTVRLMDDGLGGAQTHTIATAPVNSPGSTWIVIEKDPSTAAVITVTWSAQSSFPSLCKWRNLTALSGASTYDFIGNNTADEMLSLDNIIVDNTANKTVAAWWIYKYLRNVQLTGGNDCNFNGLAASNNGLALMLGVVGTTTSSTTNQPAMMIGCTLPRFAVLRATTSQGNHGRILYNNKLWYAAMEKITTGETLLDGLVNMQNQYEHDNSGSIVTCMNFFADADLTTVNNYLEMCNTAVGNRASRMYNDIAASKTAPNGTVKRGVSRYNVWDNSNQKADCFNSGAGSVGAWEYLFGVGNEGNVSLFGAVSRAATDAPHNDNADTPYMGCAWLPSSEYNLGRTALGFTQAQIMAMFTNYTVAPQAVPAIGGNYKPLSGSTYLKGRVPTGFQPFKKDLSGTTRRTDGTGAAGAYESA